MVYPFFYVHYIAAYSCVIFFLIIRGMMPLFQLSVFGRLVGPPVVLFLMLGGSMAALQIIPLETILGLTTNTDESSFRGQVSHRLLRLGGRHVVFVRYDASHSFQNEWVYNAADLDASPIVWCRTSESTDDSEVMQYYKDRIFWIANVGRDSVRVSRYEPGRQQKGPIESPERPDWVLERRPRGQS